MSQAVTIGMPVRNGAKQIHVALSSLIAQTHRDIRILISDNCSTDRTVDACQEFAAQDSRITVFRQRQNLGICGNFRFVLNEAVTPFFMWACHDDQWSPTFVERNLASLAGNPNAVGSISGVVMISPEGRRRSARGTSPLKGTMPHRLVSFLERPSEASWLYSVFRTEPLRQSFPDDIDVYGFDYVVLALILTRGDILQVPEFLMEREDHDYLYYHRNFSARQPSFLGRWFAAHPYVAQIRKRIFVPPGAGFRRALLRMELRHAVQHALFRFPWLQKVVGAAGESVAPADPVRRPRLPVE